MHMRVFTVTFTAEFTVTITVTLVTFSVTVTVALVTFTVTITVTFTATVISHWKNTSKKTIEILDRFRLFTSAQNYKIMHALQIHSAAILTTTVVAYCGC